MNLFSFNNKPITLGKFFGVMSLMLVVGICFLVISFNAIVYTGNAIGITGYWPAFIYFVLCVYIQINDKVYSVIPNDTARNVVSWVILVFSLLFFAFR